MKFLRRLQTVYRRRKMDAEMAEEMRLHLEMQAELNRKAGMSPQEARHAALRQFGNVAGIQERAREERGAVWLEQVGQDVRYATRALRRNPGFAVAAMLVFALGVGANTAVFSLMHRLLLARLPVTAPDELVVVERHNSTTGTGAVFPFPFFQRLQADRDIFSAVLARSRGVERVTVGTESGGEPARGELISGNYFEVLGVNPHLGRLLAATDDLTPGAHPVVVLSHRYWQSRFNGDASVVGTNVRLTGHLMTVIGVSPPGFNGLDPGQKIDLWVPLAMQAELRGGRSDPRQRAGMELQLVGRLAGGAGVAQAAASASARWRSFLEETAPVSGSAQVGRESERIGLRPAATGYGQTRQALLPLLRVLLVVTSVVMLVACLNLACLLLARAAERKHEFALRLALGAGTGRLLRQLLVEGLVLALGGAFLGGLLAFPGAAVLLRIISAEGAVPDIPAGPNAVALLGLAGVAVACGIVFGLAPAWHVRRAVAASGLRENRQGGGPPRGRSLLVGIQVAASVVVLTGAGLFLRTVHELRTTNPGFATDNLLLLALSPKNAGRNDAEAQAFFREVHERVGALPGVSSATYSMVRAMTGTGVTAAVVTEGGRLPANAPVPLRNVVGPEYFRTFRIPLVGGRDFTAGDDGRAPKVAIVSEKFARTFFPGQDPLGRKIGPRAPEYTIIGIARDVRHAHVRDPEAPQWYVPYEQFPAAKYLDLCVRTIGDPEMMRGPIQAAIAGVDRGVALFEVRTQAGQLDQLLLAERTIATLASCFGLIVVLLSAVGLHGLLAYLVTQQRRDFGIRLALGARPAAVLRMVLGRGLRLALAGILVGIPLALAAGNWTASLLFGVNAADAVTITAVILLLLAVTIPACWLPARRATKVDPVVALRAE